MKEVKLPSGAVLKVNAAPFADSKALYQAVLKEFRHIEIASNIEMAQVFKNLFCVGFSSPEIEAKLKPCLERCVYGDLKIDADTFEPEKAREDYMMACMEVARENIYPFVKSLYAEYKRILAMTEKSQA